MPAAVSFDAKSYEGRKKGKLLIKQNSWPSSRFASLEVIEYRASLLVISRAVSPHQKTLRAAECPFYEKNLR